MKTQAAGNGIADGVLRELFVLCTLTRAICCFHMKPRSGKIELFGIFYACSAYFRLMPAFSTTKRIHSAIAFIVLVFTADTALAQPVMPAVANAHSHNDYNQRSAFYAAYRQGFGSIEADIFAVNDQLFVAHDKKMIRPERTLQALYLEPIAYGLKKDSFRRLQLLIDIKENGDSVLPLLIRQLQPLQPFYSTGRLLVLISGNRPLPSTYNRYPDFIFFDDDLVHQHTPEQWARVGLVSLKFSLFAAWKGTGVIPEEDEDRLRRIVNSVHAAGKGIRFWDAPDTVAGWQEQVKLGVDFIGTDSIEQLARFLEQKGDKK